MAGHHFSAEPLTLAVDDRDHSEWRRGRERYAVWIIDADHSALRERTGLAREHLRDGLTRSQRQPHITCFVCGFPAPRLQYDDDFDDTMLARQLEALRALRCVAFELQIGRLSSFDSSAFLEVEDRSESIARIRSALSGASREIRFAPYVPHLTVGLYRQPLDKKELGRRLDGFNSSPPITLSVSALHLATYEARDIGGPLRIERSVVLG